MKHWTRVLSLALCAAMLLSLPALAAAGADTAAPDSAPAGPPAPVMIWGKAEKQENGSLRITNDSKDALHHEVIVHLTENTPWVDAVSGQPMDSAKFQSGDTLYVWAGPAMTMSLPPQTAAVVVVGNIPADARVPQFYEITGLVPTATILPMPLPERTEVKLRTAGGKELTVPAAAQISPWRTRQIVTLDDLIPGAQILVWADKDGRAEKVLLFPYAYKGYLEAHDSGEVLLDGQLLKVRGRVLEHEGMKLLYLPLRAAAEAAGFEVKWVAGTGAVVSENGTVRFSVLPGADTAKTPDPDNDHGLLGGCVLDKGVTYLPADDLAFLLDLYYCR